MSTLVYIANIRIPGERAHATQVMKMCEAFARAGIEVTLLVPRRHARLPDDPFRYHGCEQLFTIAYLPCVDTVRFGRAGFHLESLSFSFAALVRVLKSRPDTVYGRELLPLLLCRLFRMRVVFESHRGEWNILARLLARLQTPFVVISNGLKTHYQRRGVPNERIFVAHDGIDLVEFAELTPKNDARATLGIGKDARIAMYIGSLEEWKGYRTLLAAAALLPKPWQVVVIGGSPAKVEQLSKEFPHVLFLGYRPYTTLPVNQRAADALVIPNSAGTPLSSTFTSPLKVFAHMAANIPIVASDLPSLREVLKDDMATFVAPDSPRKLAEGIQSAIDPSNKGKVLRARKEAKHYSWEERALSIMTFLGVPTPAPLPESAVTNSEKDGL